MPSALPRPCRHRQKGRKFVAADTTRDIRVSELPLQFQGKFADDHIAHGVSEIVIDPFEVVNIQHKKGEAAVFGLACGQNLADVLFRGRLIVQAGQRVQPGLGGEPAFPSFFLVDVLAERIRTDLSSSQKKMRAVMRSQ